MAENPKILFVYKSLSPFIQDDLDILEKHFDVLRCRWRGYVNFGGFFELIRGIRGSDVVFTWFENYRSAVVGLLARLFKKRVILVAAGGITLCHDWKEKNYLVSGGKFPGALAFSKLSVRQASVVLAVSEFKKDGLLKHIKHDDVRVVSNCLKTENFDFSQANDGSVLTVCFISKTNIPVKGLKTFIEVARHFPGTGFLIVGKDIDGSSKTLFSEDMPANLKIITEFADDGIVGYMQRAKVYAQLSCIESFGVALAEAMLCGCVPVSTRCGNLPEVVGDTGFYCEYDDVDSTVRAIRQALEADNGARASERIKRLFPLEKRERMIVEVVKELSCKSG